MAKTKILIIEDDYAIIRGLKDSYSNKGYEVSTAMDGEQAIMSALNNDYDLILLDIMLPKANGFEICSRIREAEIGTPIIMLTARGDEEDIVRGLNLGADDYVTKPFSIKQLHARSEAFIRRYSRNKVSEYCFGCFALNLETRQLTSASEGIIKLSPKEFALLQLFVSREGYALTRQTILNVVWKSSILTTERSVDRCVNTLRKKIEKNPKQPIFIQSIRDIGYRFLSE